MSLRAGYSLFEVLLAFAIMTLVLATLLPGQASLLRRVSEGPAQILAHDYALSLLAELGVSQPIRYGKSNSIYRNWQVISEITKQSDASFQLLHITISISNLTNDAVLTQVESWKALE